MLPLPLPLRRPRPVAPPRRRPRQHRHSLAVRVPQGLPAPPRTLALRVPRKYKDERAESLIKRQHPC